MDANVPSKRRSREPLRIFSHSFALLVLFVGAAVLLIPLLWTLSTALKPNTETLSMAFFPHHPRPQNFIDALNAVPFFRFLLNTMIILVPATLGVLISSSLVAYGFSRFEFKGKRVLFLILLATMMLPEQITLIPKYLMFRQFGWVNTFYPLIVPLFFGLSFDIFLIRQFMSGIPKELDEAAIIDGANQFTVMTRIVLPLCRPVLAAVAIFTAIGRWNDFTEPLIYLSGTSQKNYTLALGLSLFKTMFKTQFNLLMASTLMAILPLLILFFVAQNYIISGVAISSGVKE